jgi:hypothetical protein
MSVPQLPENVTIERDIALNLILASIGLEEIGLAHVINAEAEKVQFVLGTLDNAVVSPVPTIEDLIALDDSVRRVLKEVIKKEMLLQFKLEEVINFIEACRTVPPPAVVITNPADGATVSGDVLITATVNSAIGVTRVVFLADGLVIGIDDDGSDGWSIIWDSTPFNGEFELTAIATDECRHSGSSSINVTVNNPT